jgi:hypothetical protein
MVVRFVCVVHVRLHMSTGAEIETALCILESVLPTLASLRYKTRKHGIWEFVGPSCCDRRGVLGNSETRNLEFGSPSALDRRGGLGNSETRNLELGGRPLGSDPRAGASETRKLGISEYAQEYPGICTLGILESGIC